MRNRHPAKGKNRRVRYSKDHERRSMNGTINDTRVKSYDHQTSFLLTLDGRSSEAYMEKMGLMEIRISLRKESSMVVIVPSYRVGLWYKLLTGINEARYLSIVASLFVIIYGVLIWLAERNSNADFDNDYKGAFQGMWLGIVTMTTLGFGDTTPRTWLGKIMTGMCVVWGLVFLSLLMGSIISIVTDAKGDVSIENKLVVVKSNSTEQMVVSNTHNSQTIGKNSYEEVLEHIADSKNSETYAAVVQSNVARYMDDLEYEKSHKHQLSLAVVDEIKQEIPIYMLVPKMIRYSLSWKDFTMDGKSCIQGCIDRNNEDIFGMRLLKYERPIRKAKSSLNLSMYEIFTEDTITICLLAIACLFLLGVVMISVQLKVKKNRQKNTANNNNQTKNKNSNIELGNVNRGATDPTAIMNPSDEVTAVNDSASKTTHATRQQIRQAATVLDAEPLLIEVRFLTNAVKNLLEKIETNKGK